MAASPWRIIDNLKIRIPHPCPIVSNKDLKNEIINRTIDLGVSLAEVCIAADVSWNLFQRNYLESENPLSNWQLRADEIIKIAGLVGIKVRITLIRQSLEKVDTDKIIKGIAHELRKKNKKLN